MPKYAKCGECGEEYDEKGTPHDNYCEGRPAGIRVLADLERRIVALEDAAEARSVELAEVVARSDRANVERREALGLLVDLAAPARKVVAFVDGVSDPAALAHEKGRREERARLRRFFEETSRAPSLSPSQRDAATALYKYWLAEDPE